MLGLPDVRSPTRLYNEVNDVIVIYSDYNNSSDGDEINFSDDIFFDEDFSDGESIEGDTSDEDNIDSI